MIERPQKSVTRFFVPLIDVLILLFCIFLLMPFVTDPGAENADPMAKPSINPETGLEEAPKNITELRKELEKTREELKKLKDEKGNLSERLNVRVIEIDPKTGMLYYFQEGQRILINDQISAQNLIDIHKRQSGTKEPFFLILFPRQRSGFPEQQQTEDYIRWFKDVQFKFDRPFAPSTP